MDETAVTLHAMLALVCPIDGVRVGDPADAKTWSFWPSTNATAEQIAVANQLLASLVPPLKPISISTADFQARFTQAEQQAAWVAMQKDASGGLGAAYTLAMTGGTVTLTDARVAAYVAGLVAMGALTQDRATAITTP